MITVFPRHEAIDTTCSNLIMAGVLKRDEVAGMMSKLQAMTDDELAQYLINSRFLWEQAIDSSLAFRKN